MSTASKKQKTVYLLDPDISWKLFKKLQGKLVRQSGPVPKEGDRALWELLKMRRILCWFADDMPGDMGLGLEIPKRYSGWKMMVIKDEKRTK